MRARAFPGVLPQGAVLAILALASGLPVNAEIHCPRIFGDGMVLQAGAPVPVWGTCAPGESVEVDFAGQAVKGTGDPSGHWRVNLSALPVNAQPADLAIHGTDTVTFHDVLVGEVWFCSGQSNMEKPFGKRVGQLPVDNQEIEVAAARHPQIRLFKVPRTDLPQKGPGLFRWLRCSPEALRQSDFSAVGYYFGNQVHEILDVPVGLIDDTFGGSHIEGWLPKAIFHQPGLGDLEHFHYNEWVKGMEPGEIFDAMVAPVAPYAVRGFLWYQGESNIMDGSIPLYAARQTALIQAWRKAWENPQAPFYGVLIAPFDYSKWAQFSVNDQGLPALWEQQERALGARGTDFVVTTDGVTDFHNIHPTHKRYIGLRLAAVALTETYGQTGIPAHGPSLQKATLAEGKAVLAFKDGAGLRTRDGLAPTGFTVAGEDRIFHPATAAIEHGTVVLTSPEVPHPVAVRFAWQECAAPNLINGAVLPAVPFRTDDWPIEFMKPGASSP